MVRTLHPAVLLALCCPFASAAPNSPWTRANSEAFEIYSDAGADSARSTLEYFQRLRAFFLSYTNLNTGSSTPVRIIVFRSAEEFNPYRVRPNAAAFYIGLAWLQPDLSPAIFVYLAEFMVVDCFLSLAFLAWPIRSPNYFFVVDRTIWLWNWSKPAKAVNSALFAVLLLVTGWMWVGLVIATALLVLKCVSLRRLAQIGLPVPGAAG